MDFIDCILLVVLVLLLMFSSRLLALPWALRLSPMTGSRPLLEPWLPSFLETSMPAIDDGSVWSVLVGAVSVRVL